MRKWLWILAAILFAMTTNAFAAIPRYSTNPNDFVRAGLGHFWLHGKPIRMMGYNLRGLVHYGYGDIIGGATAQDRITNLAYMKSVGAKVARVFVAYDNIDKVATGDRLDAALQDAAAHDVHLIVTLTDVYGVTRLYPEGDLAYHKHPGGDLLNDIWYASGYRDNYLPMVEYLVNRFKNDPTIFAWELGNELKCPWRWTDLLPFSHDVATRIRELDPNHMISHGTASVGFAGLTLEQGMQLYQDFDFVGVHVYNGEDALNDMIIANQLSKPLLVTEAGMSSSIYNYHDRPDMSDSDIQKWINRGARGYMNWGLMVPNRDIGDGDRMFGIDRVWHSGDFAAYENYWKSWANILSTTPLPAPGAPSNVAASDGTLPGRVEITWDAALGGAEYAVLRSEIVQPGVIVNMMPYVYQHSECGHVDQSTLGMYCFDGNISTMWSCAHNGPDTPGDHWIVFDLGSVCKITRYIIRHASAAGFPTSYNVKGISIESGPSMDGPWTTEFMLNNNGSASATQLVYPTPKNFRYIRFRIYSATIGQDWTVRVPEFEIWGEPGAGKTVQVSGWQTQTRFVDTTAEPGVTYLYSVRARNTAGEGPASAADSGFASSIPAVNPNQAKSQSDDAEVYLSNVVVTAVFADRIYVQQPDRSGGIGVLWSDDIVEGDMVDVFGTIITDPSGERLIMGTMVERRP